MSHIAENKLGAAAFNATLSDSEFEAFRKMIRVETGISLPPAKKDLLRTRLLKRLHHLGLTRFSQYFDYLEHRDPQGVEMVEMINRVTTNKTDFFREAHHFEFLKNTAFPEFVQRAAKTGQRKLRIWSAGCSIGAEPYTIAITLREFFERVPGWDMRILASDIDSNCLRDAASGVYDEDRIEDIELALKKKYFLRGSGASTGKVSVRQNLKDLITFRRINFAAQPWPINIKFDVIFCRNVMIYFDRDFQDQLIRGFLRQLAPHGYLILGHSENVTWLNDILESLGKTIYRPRNRSGVELPASPQLPATPASPAAGMLPAITHTAPAPAPAISIKTADRKLPSKAIVAGEVFASGEAMQITTLLGSCIAACLYDTKVKVGGMNHFLLPEGSGANSDTACYGINAMELLVNEIMQRGGQRSQMVARVYGGARVLASQLQTSRVGEKNIDFVRKYLTTEGIPIVDQKTGGEKALRVAMTAHTGDVVATELEPTATKQLLSKEEKIYSTSNAAVDKPDNDQITFF